MHLHRNLTSSFRVLLTLKIYHYYRFGVIAAYYSNFGHFAFLSPLWGGGLGTTYDFHLGLIGKRVVDFLLLELFLARCYGRGDTSENR